MYSLIQQIYHILYIVNCKMINQTFIFFDLIQKILTMKTNTPIKKGTDGRKSQYSPMKQSIMVSRKKQITEFQPGLYISAKFNQEDVIAIKQAFDTYDSNKTGLLAPNDLKVALFHQGFQATKETIYDIIAEYDEQYLGGLNFAAFMKIISSQPLQTEPLSELKKAFRKIDKDDKGYLDRRDLENLLKSLGEQWSDRDIDLILEKIDKKDKYKISFDEFCKIMHSPHSLY